jgi:hypothetical protein
LTITPGSPSCTASLPNLVTITVAGGTLTACQVGRGCPPTPPVPTGLAGPFCGPFTVIEGTGVFAGASGGGTHICGFVGLVSTFVAQCLYSGTLTLP